MNKTLLSRVRKEYAGYLFILPAVILFIIFMLWPLLNGFRLSFFKQRGAEFVFTGFDNYTYIFTSNYYAPIFWKALKNTFRYVLIIVPFTIVFSLLISNLLLDKSRRLNSLCRAAFYVPTIASSVVVSVVWRWILEPNIGFGNWLITNLGFSPSSFLADRNLAPWLVIMVISTWTVGRPIVLYTAALAGIPAHYYEAADIDGARWFQKLRFITIPMVKATTLFVLVTTTINAFQTFAVIKLLTAGGPNGATTSIIFELYNVAFTLNKYGAAAALGTMLFILIGIVAFFQFRFTTSDVEY